MAVKTVKVAAKDSFCIDEKTRVITRNKLEQIHSLCPSANYFEQQQKDCLVTFVGGDSNINAIPKECIIKDASIHYLVDSVKEDVSKTARLFAIIPKINIETSSKDELFYSIGIGGQSDKCYVLGWQQCPIAPEYWKDAFKKGIRMSARGLGGIGFHQARTVNIESARTTNAPYIEITYDDLKDVPPTVQVLSPINDIVSGDVPCVFSWSYAQQVNVPQSHYTIECDIGNGWALKVEKCEGTAQQHIFPAGSLPSGNVRWRVKAYSAYNDDGIVAGTVESEWSAPASIMVRKTPDIPIIMDSPALPRLTVEWIAHEQSGYRLRLSNGYDSDVVYGTARSRKLPLFLPNGAVTAFLSVTNANGMWSAEAQSTYTISNIPADPIAAHCVCRKNGVHISFDTDGAYSAFYLLRDDIPVARAPGIATTGSFFDALSLGKHKYKVRGDQGNGYYTDSLEQLVVVVVPCGMLSSIDEIDWIPMRLRAGEPPSHNADVMADVTFVHYQGRTSPVPYSMGFVTKTHTLSYSFRSREEYQRLEALTGQTVIYKDALGDSFIGIVTGIAPNYTRCVDFTITVTETDFTQEVAYE